MRSFLLPRPFIQAAARNCGPYLWQVFPPQMIQSRKLPHIYAHMFGFQLIPDVARLTTKINRHTKHHQLGFLSSQATDINIDRKEITISSTSSLKGLAPSHLQKLANHWLARHIGICPKATQRCMFLSIGHWLLIKNKTVKKKTSEQSAGRVCECGSQFPVCTVWL